MNFIKKFFKEKNAKRIEKKNQYELKYGKRFGFSSHIIFTKARKKRKEAKKVYKKNEKRYSALVYDITATKLELGAICRALYKFRDYDDEISNSSGLEIEMKKKIERLNGLQEELSGSVQENLDKYGWVLRKFYKRKAKKFYRWDEHKFMSKYRFDEESDMPDEFEEAEENIEISNKRSKYNIDAKTLREAEALYDKNYSDVEMDDPLSIPVDSSENQFANEQEENFDEEAAIDILIKDSTDKIENLLIQALTEIALLGMKTGDKYEELVLDNMQKMMNEYSIKMTELDNDIKAGLNLTENDIIERLNKKL